MALTEREPRASRGLPAASLRATVADTWRPDAVPPVWPPDSPDYALGTERSSSAPRRARRGERRRGLRDDGVVVAEFAPGRLVGLFQVRHGGAALFTGVVVRVRQLDALRSGPTTARRGGGSMCTSSPHLDKGTATTESPPI